MACLLLLLLLPLLVVAISGDCPPRSRAAWEHNERSVLASYNKDTMRLSCPSIRLALNADHVQVDAILGHGALELGIHMMWTDPGLVVAGSSARIKVNASEIWTPQITSMTALKLTPTGLTADILEVDVDTGFVSSFFSTTLWGPCYSEETQRWPRDRMTCHFVLTRPPIETYSFTNRSVTWPQLNQRLSAWKVLKFGTDVFEEMVLLNVQLERLPAQLEAELVQPSVLIGVLYVASGALPPWSSERPTLLATALLLHALLTVSLPNHTQDLVADAVPRNLLLFRDSALLLLLVVLQWLVTARLAARRRPLPRALQRVARALSVLRAPLLLPEQPALPTLPASQQRPRDEQSVGMSEVIDRFFFFTVAASYLAIVIASLYPSDT